MNFIPTMDISSWMNEYNRQVDMWYWLEWAIKTIFIVHSWRNKDDDEDLNWCSKMPHSSSMQKSSKGHVQ